MKFKQGDRIFNKVYGYYTIAAADCKKISVVFDNTGSFYTFHASVVYANKVKDFMARTLMGVGYLGRPTRNNKDPVEAIAKKFWISMILRCYDERRLVSRPTYRGCSVSPEWQCFANFYDWFLEQYSSGYYRDGYQLDKDLILQGNKVYSPDKCVLLPLQLNSLLQVKKQSENKYLPGVNFDKSRGLFKSEVNFKGVRYYGKRVESEIEAFTEYKQTKERLVREEAENWIGLLPEVAVNSLREYSLDWILEDSQYRVAKAL